MDLLRFWTRHRRKKAPQVTTFNRKISKSKEKSTKTDDEGLQRTLFHLDLSCFEIINILSDLNEDDELALNDIFGDYSDSSQ